MHSRFYSYILLFFFVDILSCRGKRVEGGEKGGRKKQSSGVTWGDLNAMVGREKK